MDIGWGVDVNELEQWNHLASGHDFSFSKALDLLKQVKVGMLLAGYNSTKEAAEGTRRMPRMDDLELSLPTAVSINLEQGLGTPEDLANPSLALLKFADLAHTNHFQAGIGLDNTTLALPGLIKAVAGVYTFWTLQAQNAPQTDRNAVMSYVQKWSQQIRTVRPGINLRVQFRAEGDKDYMLHLVRSLPTLGISGVMFIVTAEHAWLPEFITALRA